MLDQKVVLTIKYNKDFYVRSHLGQCAVQAVPQGLEWPERKDNLSAVLIVSDVLKESSATKQVGIREAHAFLNKIFPFLKHRGAHAH